MVHVTHHLNQTVMSRYCGHNAFEKASLIVKEEMKSLFQCLVSLSKKFFYS